jgi:hypothetical protein
MIATQPNSIPYGIHGRIDDRHGRVITGQSGKINAA